MFFWMVRLRSGLSCCSKRGRGFDQVSSCAPVAARAMKIAYEVNVNGPHLANAYYVRCYVAICTDAIATLAFFAEAGLRMHVVLFDTLSLRSDSVLTLTCARKHQTAMLVASSAICGSLSSEWSSACP